ncbi:hypothetical protein [Cohnella nanjingensis]|uniref:Uncharacterized protein n=1 Tax=Cohnella nanjingensis TaxID=1387779 RepID=A0A7X0RXV3_9BACL|nr:hypothetical protein [Cohnella nanjingensis]MBB6674476.1 hypothetical protein [Cohnella nanjingensis]
MSWVNVIGYGLSIALLAALLGCMFLMVRVLSGDAGKYPELKEMVEALFGTPAHLRPGPGAAPDVSAAGDGPMQDRPHGDPPVRSDGDEEMTPAVYDETCPACQSPVTHRHVFCPSCDLRLQD